MECRCRRVLFVICLALVRQVAYAQSGISAKTCLGRKDSLAYYKCKKVQTSSKILGDFGEYCCSKDGVSSSCTKKIFGTVCPTQSQYLNCCSSTTGLGLGLQCLSELLSKGTVVCDSKPAQKISYCCKEDPADYPFLSSKTDKISCIPGTDPSCGSVSSYFDQVCCSDPGTKPASPSPSAGSSLNCTTSAEINSYYECNAAQFNPGVYSTYCCPNANGNSTGCLPKTPGVPCRFDSVSTIGKIKSVDTFLYAPVSNVCCTGSGTNLKCETAISLKGSPVCDAAAGQSKYKCLTDPANSYFDPSSCTLKDDTYNGQDYTFCCSGTNGAALAPAAKTATVSPSPSLLGSSKTSSPSPSPALTSSSLQCTTSDQADAYFKCNAKQFDAGVYSTYCCPNDDGNSTGCVPKVIGTACGYNYKATGINSSGKTYTYDASTGYSICCTGSGPSLDCLATDDGDGLYICDASIGQSKYCCQDDLASTFFKASECKAAGDKFCSVVLPTGNYYTVCCTNGKSTLLGPQGARSGPALAPRLGPNSAPVGAPSIAPRAQITLT